MPIVRDTCPAPVPLVDAARPGVGDVLPATESSGIPCPSQANCQEIGGCRRAGSAKTVALPRSPAEARLGGGDVLTNFALSY